jgi:hypothetical protein
MDKFFKIVGIVVVAWIVLGLIGAVLGFLVKTVFWVALSAGGVYAVSAIASRARNHQIGSRR